MCIRDRTRIRRRWHYAGRIRSARHHRSIFLPDRRKQQGTDSAIQLPVYRPQPCEIEGTTGIKEDIMLNQWTGQHTFRYTFDGKGYEAEASANQIPVSYTHLDVYKRQSEESL